MGSKKKETKEKPLEKSTAKELRELALKIPEIAGVHGLNKNELVQAIKKARGIEDSSSSKGVDNTVREAKKKIKEFKAKHQVAVEANDTKMSTIYRKRVLRLKKKTRRAA